MTKKNRIKIVFILLVFVTVFATLYHHLQQSKPKPEWDLSWDKGFKAKSERIYYVNLINRLIGDWSLHGRSKMDNEGIYKDPNDRYLVIDMDKNAIWLEHNGKIHVGDYIEFAPETEWVFYYNFPGGRTELSGRTILKIRDRHPDVFHVFEQFYLRAAVPDGSISFTISPLGGGGIESPRDDIKSGFNVIHKTDESFESMIVSEEEYQQYRNSLKDSNIIQSEDENIQPKILTRLDENKKSWYGIRRNLYMEIEKQFKNYDCPIRKITEESGPDFSAARICIEADNNPDITKLPENQPYFYTYFNIDHLGNGVWYAKNIPNPDNYFDSIERDNYLPNTEFVVSSEEELLEAGRELQNSNPIPESKWEATLSNGATYQFIGICEHPSVGKQWWAPDGSPLDFVPCINERFIEKPSEEKKIYEFAWTTKSLPGTSTNTKRAFGGSDIYETLPYIPLDRYGDAAWDYLGAKAYSLDKSQKVTDCKIDVIEPWQIAITVKDKAEEIKFLDKYRVILNPPKIEDGYVVVRCYEELKSDIKGYDKSFWPIPYPPIYNKKVFDDDKTGLREHKFIYSDPNITLDDIEGVTFRYRKHSVITFKNISLVPGEDFGVEIEVIEAEE